ncbi:MAG: sulfatase [Lentisphaeraceae bacterium]|nr:sulfatase [Lentisphaeraceae bacterium]
MKVVFILMLLPLSLCFANDSKKPNIVFLLADDMNKDHWGIFGSVDSKTPSIDEVGKNGVIFTNAFCSVAMCAPFRQELYSGRSPWRTGTLANHSKSKPITKSLPHYLKPLGYNVALIGKSHVGPNKAYPFDFFSGKDKKKDKNDFYIKTTKEYIQKSLKNDKPFCVFIASNDSHAPFTTGDKSKFKADELTIPPYWIDTPELRETLVSYYAEVNNFDSLIGRMKNELQKMKLWENTIFIVCSEQGSQLPFSKWTCYKTGLNTGIVAHWPKATVSKVNQLLMTRDIAPTLVEAAGYKIKENDFDGKSFLEALKGDTKEINDYAYGAFTNVNILDNKKRVYPIRTIRNKEYTLIYNPNSSEVTSNLTLSQALKMKEDSTAQKSDIASSWVELARKNKKYESRVNQLNKRSEYEFYLLEKDPHELSNQINNPEYKNIIDKLKKQLHQTLNELNDSNPIKTEKSLMKR